MPFLNSLGWSLLNSLWQMAGAWLLYLLITGNHKRFSPKARYSLVLILVAVQLAFSVFNLVSDNLTPSFALSGAVFSGLVHLNEYDVSFFLPYISCSYLIALMVLFGRSLAQYRHIQKLRGSKLVHPGLYWSVFTERRGRELGIRRKVKVWISSRIDVPQTIGFLKPLILLPVAMINHLSPEQAESILLHELIHIRRNDYLINIFLTIFGTLFFFNPFARLLIRTMKKEREYCCDDLVIQFRYPVHTYVSALVVLEKARSNRLSFALASVGSNKKLLLERVKRLTGHPGKNNLLQFSVLPAILLACMVLLFSPLTPAKNTVPARNPPKQNKKALSGQTKMAGEPALAAIIYTVEGREIKSKKTSGNAIDIRKKIEWASIKNQDTEAAPQAEADYADKQDARDFSNESSVTIHIPLEAMQDHLPFVPASSFIYPPTADSLEDLKEAIKSEIQPYLPDLPKEGQTLKQIFKKNKKQAHIVYI